MSNKIKLYLKKYNKQNKKLRRKNINRVASLVIMTIFMVTMTITEVITMEKDNIEGLTTNINKEQSKGNLQVKVKDDFPEDINIEVKIKIFSETDGLENSYLDPIRYELIDKEKNIKSSGISEIKQLGEKEIYDEYTFQNLQKGDILTIYDVPSKQYIGNNQAEMNARIMAVSSDEQYRVDEIKIAESDMVSIDLSVNNLNERILDVPKIETNNRFETIGGSYTFEHILGNYNIFSFENIEGTHIVGPIVAKNKVYRTKDNESGNGKLVAADYTEGVSSYAGIIDNIENTNEATFELNYAYDILQNQGVDKFNIPEFYTRLTENMVSKELEEEELYYFHKDGNKFLSPNLSGYGETLQSDNFINFEQARANLIQESNSKAQSSENIEVEPESETGYLKIEVGKNYVIKNAQDLRVIDFIYPKGYDPLENVYPKSTIINITGETLPTSGRIFKGFSTDAGFWVTGDIPLARINNEIHQYFPITLVNGKQFNGAQSIGEGFEHGKLNNIVFNLPNIKTKNGGHKVILKHNMSDVLGHIVAPSAEFWNYDESGWNGGNMNGSAIVDSWHAGTLESHMWPFKPNIISFIKKDVDTDAILPEAEFELVEVVSRDDHTPVNPEVVFKSISDQNGEITFEGIMSNKVYKMTEVKAPTGYEKPEGYWIVEVMDNEDKLDTNVISFGGAPEIGNDNVIPNDKKSVLSFTIIKTDEESGELLPNAVFDLFNADIEGNPEGEAIIKDIITDKNGVVNVESGELKYDTLYVLVERVPPDGYIKGDNIIFYIKGTDNLFQDISDKIIIENNGQMTITNSKELYILPDTGGNGIYNNVLLGLAIILASSALINIKKRN